MLDEPRNLGYYDFAFFVEAHYLSSFLAALDHLADGHSFEESFLGDKNLFFIGEGLAVELAVMEQQQRPSHEIIFVNGEVVELLLADKSFRRDLLPREIVAHERVMLSLKGRSQRLRVRYDSI